MVHGDGDDKNVIAVVDGIDESRVAQDVKISKVDLGGVEVDGAKLQVLEAGSDSVVKDVMTQEPAEWTTSKNEKVHKVSLLPGSYRLKESLAPQGLRPITTFEFSVNAQGAVTVKNVAVAGRNAAGREVKEAVVNDEGVVVVTDGAQKSEKPKESSGWKIGNVGAVIGAGIIGLLSVMVVRYLTLVLQMFTRA
nr:SpaA isopeptide-forming pilin-related protein [Corynebacterium diphtheriae]